MLPGEQVLPELFDPPDCRPGRCGDHFHSGLLRVDGADRGRDREEVLGHLGRHTTPSAHL